MKGHMKLNLLYQCPSDKSQSKLKMVMNTHYSQSSDMKCGITIVNWFSQCLYLMEMLPHKMSQSSSRYIVCM